MSLSVQETIKKVLREDQNASPTRVKPEYQDLGDPAVAPGQPKASPNHASDTISHAQDPRPKPSDAGPDDQRASDPESTDNYPKNKHLKMTPGDPGGHGTLPNDHQGSGNAPVNPGKKVPKTLGEDDVEEMEDKDDVKETSYKMHEKDDVSEGDDKDDDDKKMQYEMKDDDIKESISQIFEGEELTEKFKTKVETLFTVALKESVANAVTQLEEHYEGKLNSRVEEIREELSTNVDAYLSYVSEDWVKKNEVAIENGIRTHVAEQFIQDLKTLFESSYIEVPESKVDVVAQLSEETEQVKADLAEQLENNLVLVSAIKDMEKEAILKESTANLVDTDAARVIELAESVEYRDAETFTEAVNVLVESTQKSAKKKAPKTLTEQVEDAADGIDVPKVSSNRAMDTYVAAADRYGK